MCLTFAACRVCRIAAVPAVFALLSVCPVAGQIPDGPYFGQDPPGMIPEIFAPGIVSLDDRREARIGFSPDGQQCAIDARLETLYTQQVDGHWLPWDDTTFGNNGTEPFFSPDGVRFYLQRSAEIKMSEFQSGQWSSPVNLPSPVNSFMTGEYLPTATADGTLYFTSDRDGAGGPGSSAFAIYRAPLVGGAYPVVEMLGPEINGPDGAWDPFISPDESYLIFGIDRADGANTDLYISYANPDGTWTEPSDLGPIINTDAIEYGPYISYDGNYLFFGRPEGWDSPDQPSDIFWVDSAAVFDPQFPAATVGDDTCHSAAGASTGAFCGQDADCSVGEACGLKSRYTTITLPPDLIAASIPSAIQVEVVSNSIDPSTVGQIWWAGPEGPVDNAPSPPLAGAELECTTTPSSQVWTLGYLHLHGEVIVPGASYNVRVCDVSGATCSEPLLVSTGKWGDVVPPYGGASQPAFGDISSVVDKFRTIPAAPDMPRADLVGDGNPGGPDIPNHQVNFADISAAVDSFRQQAYAYAVPSCP